MLKIIEMNRNRLVLFFPLFSAALSYFLTNKFVVMVITFNIFAIIFFIIIRITIAKKLDTSTFIQSGLIVLFFNLIFLGSHFNDFELLAVAGGFGILSVLGMFFYRELESTL